ncbi:MAG: hypothetical protein PT120_07085 [Aphanizomenon gracile PMC649.10]|nr:hypothetical protein [Aphanizomenon gracile PMC627.10]MDM3854669.1 hypothetical protein [Aphanizomenon gracile PMC649.10]
MKYLTPEQVDKQFGYHPKTTAEWADLGKIECISLGDIGDIQSQHSSKQSQWIKRGFFMPVSAQKPSC